MRQFRKFGGIEGYYCWMKTVVSINKSLGNKTAEYRLKVLQHYWKHGMASSLDAYPVSRASILRWQRQLKSSGKLTSLIPQSTRPKRVRRMQVELPVAAKIKDLRKTWPNLSKHKLKPHLDLYCQENGYNTLSKTTIGKIIKRSNLFFPKQGRVYHDPGRKKKAAKTKTRVWRAPEQVPGYIEADLVETQLDGKKRYTICWIDIGSKVAYSKTYERKLSKNILESFLEFEKFYPGKIHTFQTDNGSEFEGALDAFLTKERPEIKRVYIPVKSPKVNGVVERYNRTLQDDWLNYHLHLFHDLEAWNQSLSEYLHFYNFQHVHEAIQYQIPMQKAGVQKSLICM